MSARITQQDIEKFIDTYVRVTDEQIKSLKNLKQGSEEWHKMRIGRIGMSEICAATGKHNKRSCEELLRDMVWPELRKEQDKESERGKKFFWFATNYGKIMEDHAVDLACIRICERIEQLGYKYVWIEKTGICIWKEKPWFSVSSDGLIYVKNSIEEKPKLWGTLENKAPYSLRVYNPVPEYYYAQFQGAAHILGVNQIVFTVYTPESTEISFYELNRQYTENMFIEAEKFYMERYVPAAILRKRGLLEPGHIDLKPVIDVTMLLQSHNPIIKTVTKPKKRKKAEPKVKKIIAKTLPLIPFKKINFNNAL